MYFSKNRKYQSVVILIGLTIVFGLTLAPFMSASCSTQRTTQTEAEALASLRSMTHGGGSPAEEVVTRIENAHPGTTAGALARLLRASVKFNRGDYAAAAQLLEAPQIRTHTALADYALLLRAQALDKAARPGEARAAYEQLTREFPQSLRAREATLRGAELAQQAGGAVAALALVKPLSDKDDPTALLMAAQIYEQQGDRTRALTAYRRIRFYAPAAPESTEATAAIVRLGSTPVPATVEEAIMRADKLSAAKLYGAAAEAYTNASQRFPNSLTAPSQLRRGIAAVNARRSTEAIAALSTVPAGAGELHAEALYHLAQLHAKSRQWSLARIATGELQRTFPKSAWTARALVAAGQEARSAKNTTDALYFFRAAVALLPGTPEVAPAQFELAWMAHEAGDFQESSKLFIEHLASYADRNTDFRGRAGYWAGRDTERAGRIAEARALYEAMQPRYGANWYGQLAGQRLDQMKRTGGNSSSNVSLVNFAPNSLVARAVANLSTVTVAPETADAAADEIITKANQLATIGFDEWALEELSRASEAAPASSRINLAIARVHRASNHNLLAFIALRRSFPDYSQMKPEEMTREEWDVFYPLAHWDIITAEARAKRLDPYQVAGLIRQESVFDPRAVSPANAYGLMQLLVPTGRQMARRYGVTRTVTTETLFEPRLNIQLGTGYLRDQLDEFGRIEYAAAAYNAGPGRAVRWRAELPVEIDEWAEAVPFKETRGYVQGVVRNTLQYKRLYDEQGQFRPEVGRAAVRSTLSNGEASAIPSGNSTVRPRRTAGRNKNNEE
ncbi:MAG: tetratricopeptide repeat protein [Pyrinomonadaceae bacterium]|nr:tetratricopeptide repeat protein [Pyrinomonadaceae bacterium]